MKVVEEFLRLTQILDLSDGSRVCMGLTWQKFRQKFELVFLVLFHVLVCCHNKNVKRCVFFLGEA